MDLVGYSTLLLDEQRQYLEQLTEIVRGTEQVRSAKEAGKLIQLPVGDGMALVFFEGCTYLAQGDSASAQNAFEQARPAFEAAVKEAPGSAERHAGLGLLYAFMGRKGDAIKEGQRAVELKPESKDAVDGSLMNGYLALIYARVGENDLAIPLIERLLATPGAVDSANYSITVNDLKHRWEWDPIRDDSRFKRLIAEKGP
jgi:tetratricopeptide (TPR) repeat protein